MAATLLGWAILALILILATEAAYRTHRWVLQRRPPVGDDDEQGSGYVLSAALGLLGLLIAFVFGMATDRYEGRRLLVVDEANAISTAALRYKLLPQPHRDALARTMADYVVVRRNFFDSRDDMTKVRAAEARTEVLQAAIWREAAAGVAVPEGQRLTVVVLGATNGMFDLAASRHAALDARIPGRALRVLVLYAIVAALIMGHSLAPTNRRRLVSTSGLFMLVALAISLIFDLDSPRVGGVLVPQAPLEHVADQIVAAAKALPPPTAPTP